MFNFLTCEWRKLAVANYIVDSSLLQKYLPHKTILDTYNDNCYVSLVGFMFCNTKAIGVKIPYHVNFEEVNLRFYVKYSDENKNTKRGVVFIKEIVPKPMLTFIARKLYKENYVTMPMNHNWVHRNESIFVDYSWNSPEWNSLHVKASDFPREIEPGSEEEFIFEHYWGYTKVNQYKTFEYQVEHPRWQMYPIEDFTIDVAFEKLYGPEFQFLKNKIPDSVFLAEGSEVRIKSKKEI